MPTRKPRSAGEGGMGNIVVGRNSSREGRSHSFFFFFLEGGGCLCTQILHGCMVAKGHKKGTYLLMSGKLSWLDIQSNFNAPNEQTWIQQRVFFCNSVI